MSEALVRRSNKLSPSPTRRPRIRERRLITPEDSTYQNVVLLDTDEGAEVEFHLVVNSESLFILSGTFEVLLIDGVQTLQPGDLVYFPGNYSHGLRCSKGPGQFLAIFAPARGSRNSAWLETSYVEAWRQYVHEDRLSQTRNNLYLGVQAAFVALLTAAAGFLLPLDPVVIGATRVSIGLAAFGSLAAVFAVFALLLTLPWASVTRSGMGYIRARTAVILAIEDAVGSKFPTALQQVERRWKEFSSSHPGKEYFPFLDRDHLAQYSIPPYEQIGGWKSILSVIGVVRIVWALIGFIGLGVAALALLRGL